MKKKGAVSLSIMNQPPLGKKHSPHIRTYTVSALTGSNALLLLHLSLSASFGVRSTASSSQTPTGSPSHAVARSPAMKFSSAASRLR